jgi:hypothetical protein
MATWSIRSADGVHEDLTIYQVQQRLRSGSLGPETEVAQGGVWMPLHAVPALAKFLPIRDPAGPPAPGELVQVHGLELKVGEDGKPLPPSADVVARMLAEEAAATRIDGQRATRLTRAVAFALALGAALAVLGGMCQLSRAAP